MIIIVNLFYFIFLIFKETFNSPKVTSKNNFYFPKNSTRIVKRVPNNVPLFNCAIDVKIYEIKTSQLTASEYITGNNNNNNNNNINIKYKVYCN